jgi:hypothetical protein
VRRANARFVIFFQFGVSLRAVGKKYLPFIHQTQTIMVPPQPPRTDRSYMQMIDDCVESKEGGNGTASAALASAFGANRTDHTHNTLHKQTNSTGWCWSE